MRRHWPVVVSLLVMLPTQAQAGKVSVCEPTIEYLCGDFGGCRTSEGPDRLLIDWDTRTYTRCGKRDACRSFPAEVLQANPRLITIRVPDFGISTDISFNGSYFVERFDNPAGVFLTIGTCKM